MRHKYSLTETDTNIQNVRDESHIDFRIIRHHEARGWWIIADDKDNGNCSFQSLCSATAHLCW